jgi:hypothetical protein
MIGDYASVKEGDRVIRYTSTEDQGLRDDLSRVMSKTDGNSGQDSSNISMPRNARRFDIHYNTSICGDHFSAIPLHNALSGYHFSSIQVPVTSGRDHIPMCQNRHTLSGDNFSMIHCHPQPHSGNHFPSTNMPHSGNHFPSTNMSQSGNHFPSTKMLPNASEHHMLSRNTLPKVSGDHFSPRTTLRNITSTQGKSTQGDFSDFYNTQPIQNIDTTLIMCQNIVRTGPPPK